MWQFREILEVFPVVVCIQYRLNALFITFFAKKNFAMFSEYLVSEILNSSLKLYQKALKSLFRL